MVRWSQFLMILWPFKKILEDGKNMLKVVIIILIVTRGQ